MLINCPETHDGGGASRTWLSHSLSESTPAYGGGEGFERFLNRDMEKGDTCQATTLKISCHIGTHVDAPKHFVRDGKTVDQYLPDDWMFYSVVVLDVNVEAGCLIVPNMIPDSLLERKDIDLLLFRTGFEAHRETDYYWEYGPGLHPDLASFLKDQFPSLKAIGLDIISLTCFQHREMGRKAHQEFLGAGFCIFEDMSLGHIDAEKGLKQVIALPLRFSEADGAPCSIVAWKR